MCGIVGAVATRDITPVLVEGLRRLEYRGYDSCGVALLAGGALTRSRSTARVADLDAQLKKSGLAGHLGISHTRWATHGAPGHDQRAPALLARRGCGRPQRDHRELRGDPRRAEARRLRVRHRDRQRGDRAPGPLAVQGRPVRRRPRRGRAVQGRLRDRRRAQGRAEAPRGRAAGFAAGRGRRQGRELPRLRRDGARRHDRPDHLSRGRRRRRHRPRSRADRRRHRQEREARGADGAGGQRGGRARPVPPLHAEGDLRAAARDQRHAGIGQRHRPGAVRRQTRRSCWPASTPR